jgi:hypothetical protein
MNVLKISLTCIGATVLGACGVVPSKVVYDKYGDATKSTSLSSSSPAYFFRHRRSTLLVRSDDEGKLTVIASPTEMTPDGLYAPLYRIQGIDNFKSTTQLKVSYIDNTKFVDELTVTTKDNVADTIAKVGSLVKAVIPVAASFVSGGEVQLAKIKPTVVDPAIITGTGWFKDPVNKNLCIRVRGTAVESTETLEQFLNSSGPQHSFPVPACATSVVDLALLKTASDCGNQSIAAAAVSSTQVTFSHQTVEFRRNLIQWGCG